MSAAAAFFLLAEAATACAPAPSRLRAGAIVIRPVATADAPPFALLGPAAPLTIEPKIRKTAATEKSEDERAKPALEQCRAADIHMV